MITRRCPDLPGRLARLPQRLLHVVLLRVPYHKLRKAVLPDARLKHLAPAAPGKAPGPEIRQLRLRQALLSVLSPALLHALRVAEVEAVRAGVAKHLRRDLRLLRKLDPVAASGKDDPSSGEEGTQELAEKKSNVEEDLSFEVRILENRIRIVTSTYSVQQTALL